MFWKICIGRGVALSIVFPLMSAVVTQAQIEQPPANYSGPDTYGLCAWVVGDTEFYSKTFYVSSYFRPQAEAAVREYASSQAKGATAKAACRWSYRQSMLATMEETDKRLAGLPGHPARVVDTDWTFQGGTIGAAQPVAAGQPVSPTTYAARATAPTTANSYTNSAASTSNAASYPQRSRQNAAQTTPTYGQTSVAGTTQAGSTRMGTLAAGGVDGTTNASSGSMLGGSRQALSDAKGNAVTQASAGMTTATNTAVNGAMGALNNGMQSMFTRHSKKPQPADAQGPSGVQTQPAAAADGGMNFAAASAPEPPLPVAAASGVEGLVADVAASEVIVNVGQAAGLRVGQVLTVSHVQRVVKDPVSGKPLRTVEASIGDLRLTSVDANSASGTFTGTGVPAVGDKVHLKP